MRVSILGRSRGGARGWVCWYAISPMPAQPLWQHGRGAIPGRFACFLLARFACRNQHAYNWKTAKWTVTGRQPLRDNNCTFLIRDGFHRGLLLDDTRAALFGCVDLTFGHAKSRRTIEFQIIRVTEVAACRTVFLRPDRWTVRSIGKNRKWVVTSFESTRGPSCISLRPFLRRGRHSQMYKFYVFVLKNSGLIPVIFICKLHR